MKTKLLYSALIASCLVALSSCDPNDWNDKLDGFDGDKGITNKQMIAYTFTDADYTNLAANSANIKQAGDTLSKEPEGCRNTALFHRQNHCPRLHS